MKTSNELKQERNELVNAQNALIKKAQDEKREFTPEEATEFETRDAEIKEFDTKIERATKVEDAQKRAASAAAGQSVVDGEQKEKDKVFERASIIKAIRAMHPGNSEKLEGAEKEMDAIGKQESRDAKVQVDDNSLSIPLRYISRATQQTVTQDSGSYGGALVQNQAPMMVEPLRPKLAFEALGATFMTGLSGGNIPLIVDNDFAMTFIAEGAAITPQKKTYAGPTLAPKRAGGAVDITNQLLLQSSVDVEMRVSNGIQNGFKQLLHSACINGAGGVAPTGILSYSGTNTAAATVGTAASWAQIVELQALIEEDDATDESLGWLLHPKLKAALKQIKKDAGSGRFLLEGDVIDGYRYISTSLVPVLDDGEDPAVTVYPMVFGDWRQMVIGQWGSINVKIDPYSALLSDSVRLVLNTHADMQIANPKAFAINGLLSDALS